MTDANSFAKLVPGFDFLQGLVKNAGAALPGIGQWVAPTLDPEALDKRIEELRTVQFWLEQNGRMLGATIQALEVQKMTLTTLKTMNVQMSDLRDSLKINLPEAPAPAQAAASPAPRSTSNETPSQTAPGAGPSADGAAPAVDPMQWWGALTKQFTELATNALQESQGMAAAMGRRSFDGVETPAGDPEAGDDKPESAPARAARKSGSARKRAANAPASAKGTGG